MGRFLLFCLLEDSPSCEAEQEQLNVRNKALVVNQGRAKNLQLHLSSNSTLSLSDWGHQLLDKIAAVAELLDKAHDQPGASLYADAVATQRCKLTDASLTPSAQLLAAMKKGQSFAELSLDLARQHKAYFKAHTRSAEMQALFEQQSLDSLQKQRDLEASSTESFDDFLAHYNAL